MATKHASLDAIAIDVIAVISFPPAASNITRKTQVAIYLPFPICRRRAACHNRRGRVESGMLTDGHGEAHPAIVSLIGDGANGRNR
jgi:hypothetical protein